MGSTMSGIYHCWDSQRCMGLSLPINSGSEGSLPIAGKCRRDHKAHPNLTVRSSHSEGVVFLTGIEQHHPTWVHNSLILSNQKRTNGTHSSLHKRFNQYDYQIEEVEHPWMVSQASKHDSFCLKFHVLNSICLFSSCEIVPGSFQQLISLAHTPQWYGCTVAYKQGSVPLYNLNNLDNSELMACSKPEQENNLHLIWLPADAASSNTHRGTRTSRASHTNLHNILAVTINNQTSIKVPLCRSRNCVDISSLGSFLLPGNTRHLCPMLAF